MNALEDFLHEQDRPSAVLPVEKPPPRDRGDITVTLPTGWTVEYKHGNHRYKIDGEYVVSVSAISDTAPDGDKVGRLKWWAMKIGVDGTLELVRRGVVDADAIAGAEMESLVSLLTEQKLTVNHVLRAAADRGSRVHDAMEDWALSGVNPDPAGLPEDEQGYVHGLQLAINELGLQPETASVEAIVASKQHGIAGRCDLLRCTIPKPVVACVGIAYKTGEETRTIVPTGDWLLDLKTSSGVWGSHHFQTGGYEGLSVESGYKPTDYQGILRVTVDGRYELVESVATYADFLAVKAAFDAGRRVDKLGKKAA